MENTNFILNEKRKNLFEVNKNKAEIFLNKAVFDLVNIFDGETLLNFFNGKSDEMIFGKSEFGSRLSTKINPIETLEDLNLLLQRYNFDSFSELFPKLT
jgi:hypothetical protein